MSDNKREVLIERLIAIFEEVSARSEDFHPRRAISLLEARLSSVLFEYQTLDLLTSTLWVSFLRRLFDGYFDKKIDILGSDELDKSSIAEEMKSMIKREFQDLHFAEYFDADYILRLSKLKERFSVFSEGLIGEEEQAQIIAAIGRATDKILEELKEIHSEFLQKALDELNEKRSINSLEKFIKEFVSETHRKIMGWS
ncbi:MAG: hypothetical protein ACXQTR_05905 [Candidatus Methanospirareceae archaeon]